MRNLYATKLARALCVSMGTAAELNLITIYFLLFRFSSVNFQILVHIAEHTLS